MEFLITKSLTSTIEIMTPFMSPYSTGPSKCDISESFTVPASLFYISNRERRCSFLDKTFGKHILGYYVARLCNRKSPAGILSQTICLTWACTKETLY